MTNTHLFLSFSHSICPVVPSRPPPLSLSLLSRFYVVACCIRTSSYISTYTYTHQVLGTPGGDFGEFVLGLGSIETLYGVVLSQGEIEPILRRYLETAPDFFFLHTTKAALAIWGKTAGLSLKRRGNTVHDTVRGTVQDTVHRVHGTVQDSSVDSTSEPQAEDPLEPWTDSAKARLLLTCSKPEAVGCTHIRGLLEDPSAYVSRSQIAESLLRAFFDIYLTVKGALPDPLRGRLLFHVHTHDHHHEQGVVTVHTTLSAANGKGRKGGKMGKGGQQCVGDVPMLRPWVERTTSRKGQDGNDDKNSHHHHNHHHHPSGGNNNDGDTSGGGNTASASASSFSSSSSSPSSSFFVLHPEVVRQRRARLAQFLATYVDS